MKTKTHTLHIKVPQRVLPFPGYEDPIISYVDLLKKVIEKRVHPKSWDKPEVKKDMENNYDI